jgi:DNA polymerase-3 subunit delta
VLPRLSTTALENLLHGAHVVDGIVKGLKAPGLARHGWQALQRLADAVPGLQQPAAALAQA